MSESRASEKSEDIDMDAINPSVVGDSPKQKVENEEKLHDCHFASVTSDRFKARRSMELDMKMLANF